MFQIMSENPARQLAFDPHSLLGEARRQAWQALLIGQFASARQHSTTLARLADQYKQPDARALARAMSSILVSLIQADTTPSRVLVHQGLNLISPAATALDRMALAWAQILVALLDHDPLTAQSLLSTAFRLELPFSPVLGSIQLVLHAMLEAENPATGQRAVQYFALAWSYAMPDGGWLAQSPYCQQVARSLREQLGADAYRRAWFIGEALPFQATLNQLRAYYNA